MFLEYPEFLSEQECDDISELITDREPWVLKNIPTTPETKYKGLTSKYYDFNWLPWVVDAGIDIRNRLFNIDILRQHETLWIQCWCNVLRQGQGLQMHHHATDKNDNPFYVGHIFIDGHIETGTDYEELNRIVPSEKGALHIIGAEDNHKVVLNQYEEPRISMALDIWHTNPMEFFRDDKAMVNGYVISQN